MALAFGFHNFALGQETNTFHPSASYTVSYDDNVLALPDKAAARLVTGQDDMSDMAQTAQAGFALEQRIGRQNLSAKASLNKTRYSSFSELDHEGRDMQANWNWHVGNHLEGNLGASYIRALTPYSDFHALERNLRTQRNQHVDAVWQLHPIWRLRAGLSSYTLNYELPSQRPGNRDETRTEVGFDYVARSGSLIGVVLARVSGDYPDRSMQHDAYEQDELKLRVNWLVSGKTSVQATGGWVSRRLSGSNTDDFSGPNARLAADWATTGKTSIRAEVWRETSVDDDVSALYSVNTGISITPTWKATERFSLQASARYGERDVKGRISTTNYSYRTTSLSLQYTPFKLAAFKLTLFRDERGDAGIQRGYERNGASFTTALEF